MLLFALLAIVLIVLIVIAFAVLGTLGGVAVFIFADVIVCIGIILLIMKILRDRKRNRK